MEKSNKVMNIIVNCTAFLVIVLFIVGMFALPPISASAAGASESASAYSIISDLFDLFKQMGQAQGGQLGTLIGRMLNLLTFVVVFAVFAIMGLVKSIILLVKSIKSISKPEDNKPAIKQLVSFGAMCLTYATLVLAIFYSKTNLGYGAALTTSLGAGAVMVLISGLLALCAAGAYVVVTRKEEPLLTRILGVGTSALAVVAIMLMFFAPVASEYSKGGLVAYLCGLIGGVAASAGSGLTPDYVPVIMAFLGAAMLFVGLGFGKMVLTNGFKLSEKKDVDYAKSSIVKSSVWLGLSVVGVILCFVANKDYSIGIGGIMTFVFVALTLGCAIVNKVLAGKFAASKEEAPKAE